MGVTVKVIVVLIAFAANSLLCRAALVSGEDSAFLFTWIRLLSGTLSILIVVVTSSLSRSSSVFSRSSSGDERNPDSARGETLPQESQDAPSPTLTSILRMTVIFGAVTRLWQSATWKAAVCLLGYAVLFSVAYTKIHAGIGALLLFGAVQITMIGYGLATGERLSWRQQLGFTLALIGVVVLVLPIENFRTGLESVIGSEQSTDLQTANPEAWLFASLAMLCAGVCWGAYSIMGKRSGDPTLITGGNFLKASIIASIAMPFAGIPFEISNRGLLLGVVSGALTSGLGYILWYSSVKQLRSADAATLQLSVPILAAVGGAAILAEWPTWKLFVAACLTLGGIYLFIRSQSPSPPQPPSHTRSEP